MAVRWRGPARRRVWLVSVVLISLLVPILFSANGLRDADSSRWQIILKMINALPEVNDESYPDLKLPNVVTDLAGLRTCRFEEAEVKMLDQLAAIFEEGQRRVSGGSEYIRTKLATIQELDSSQRAQLMAASSDPNLRKWAIGGLRQHNCRALIQQEFDAGADRSEILMAVPAIMARQ